MGASEKNVMKILIKKSTGMNITDVNYWGQKSHEGNWPAVYRIVKTIP